MLHLIQETDDDTNANLLHFINFRRVKTSKKRIIFFLAHFFYPWYFHKNIKRNAPKVKSKLFLLNSSLIIHASMTKIQTSPKWKIIKINAWLLVQKSSDLSKLFFDVTYKPQKTLLSPKFGPKGYLTSAEKTKKPRMTQMLVYNLGNVSKRSETVFFGKFGAFRTIWHLGVASSNLKQKELCRKTKSFESTSQNGELTVVLKYFHKNYWNITLY